MGIAHCSGVAVGRPASWLSNAATFVSLSILLVVVQALADCGQRFPTFEVCSLLDVYSLSMWESCIALVWPLVGSLSGYPTQPHSSRSAPSSGCYGLWPTLAECGQTQQTHVGDLSQAQGVGIVHCSGAAAGRYAFWLSNAATFVLLGILLALLQALADCSRRVTTFEVYLLLAMYSPRLWESCIALVQLLICMLSHHSTQFTLTENFNSLV